MRRKPQASDETKPPNVWLQSCELSAKHPAHYPPGPQKCWDKNVCCSKNLFYRFTVIRYPLIEISVILLFCSTLSVWWEVGWSESCLLTKVYNFSSQETSIILYFLHSAITLWYIYIFKNMCWKITVCHVPF